MSNIIWKQVLRGATGGGAQWAKYHVIILIVYNRNAVKKETKLKVKKRLFKKIIIFMILIRDKNRQVSYESSWPSVGWLVGRSCFPMLSIMMTVRRIEIKAPIGKWRCNFPPLEKICQTDQPINRRTPERIGRLYFQKLLLYVMSFGGDRIKCGAALPLPT